MVAKFCIADTSNELVMGVFTFPMPCTPKYMNYWTWISSIFICSTCLKTLLSPVPVCTMNTRHPQPYFLAKLSKCSTKSLLFETEISNLSASFFYLLFGLKINVEPLWISGIYIPLEWDKHIVHFRNCFLYLWIGL